MTISSIQELRNKRQAEFADAYIHRPFENGGILYLTMRFGKIKTSINILNTMKNPKVLIAYPDVEIKKSWLKDFKEFKYSNPNVTFTTFRSLSKCTKEKYDVLIIDEIHLLSPAQIVASRGVKRKETLGLTGTMTKWTERDVAKELDLHVVARYPLAKAIEEGIVADYEITVIKTPLDNSKKIYKEGTQTEKKRFDALSWVLNKIDIEGGNPKMLRLMRMRVIQNSIAKLALTKHLLKKWRNERVLVFCGLQKIANELECPVFHSKKGSREEFQAFARGNGNHYAVVKIGNTGVTYNNLNRVIINYFDSNGENLAQKINRAMSVEFSNPNKKAYIVLISSDEPVEAKWLENALHFLSPEKIKFVDFKNM